MSSPADLFGHIYVINLPERTDRLKAITRELHALGMPLTHSRVSVFVAERCMEAAGFPSKAVRGCFLSHLSILRDAQHQALRTVLIMEDDLAVSPSFATECGRLLQEAESCHWGFIYFGHIEPSTTGVPRLARHYGSLGTTHFYAVNATVIGRLIAYLEQVQLRPPGDPAGGPMHYDGALTMFRQANPDVVTLIAQPNLGWQRSSRSDIHGHWFDKVGVLRATADYARQVRQQYRDLRTASLKTGN